MRPAAHSNHRSVVIHRSEYRAHPPLIRYGPPKKQLDARRESPDDIARQIDY